MSLAQRLAGLLLALGSSAGCAQPDGTSGETTSAVLITSDTLRRDHLGCYGYFRDTSPRIDAFAAECVLFEQALAPMATTLPSHLSMLTGLYAHQHGMSSNGHAARDPFRSAQGRRSMAEGLRDAGYVTAAFVSSAPLSARTGIDAGFELYSEPESRLRRGKATVRAATAWLDERDPSRPFFLWVHLWEPHDPNKPRGAYAELFDGGPELEAWVEGAGIDVASVEREFRSVPHLLERFVSEEHAGAPLDRAAILDMVDRYDADVRYVDDCVGDLVDALRERGLLETSVVAFTGDHGQSLGELGWLGHARILDPNLFVPLMIRVPGGSEPPRRVSGVVSLVDLMPTLVARLPGDFAALLEQAEGVDLLSDGRGDAGVLVQQTSRDLHVREHSGVQFALYEGRWKLWEQPGRPPRLHDREGAGDVEDVAAGHPEVVRRMQARMEALLGRRPHTGNEGTPEGGAEADELLEALEALGYVGER